MSINGVRLPDGRLIKIPYGAVRIRLPPRRRTPLYSNSMYLRTRIISNMAHILRTSFTFNIHHKELRRKEFSDVIEEGFLIELSPDSFNKFSNQHQFEILL